MPGATSALYDPLIERELAAIPAAADAFAAAHSDLELWQAVTRFAVLAYSPSQHGKRTVMACRAAYDMRDELGDEWRAMIVACATYAASSRQPWSEPPILDEPRTVSWDEMRKVAKGDALLLLDTVQALAPLLGEKGRSALLRIVDAELAVESEDVTESLDVLIDRAIAEKGSIESVRNVFVAAVEVRSAVRSARAAVGDAGTAHCKPDPSRPFVAGVGFAVNSASSAAGAAGTVHCRPDPDQASHAVGVRSPVFQSSAGETPAKAMSTAAEDWKTGNLTPRLHPYDLGRDYAQTLIAHAVARTLPSRADEFLAAVHHNLEHGESYAAWSLA